MHNTLRNCIFVIKNMLFLAVFTMSVPVSAKEGMCLAPALKYRKADMKAMGLKIPIDKIYNKSGTGLNNAVVLFGRGCTGEIISSRGLVLTNHHCGYGPVQGLSNPAHDYFANGFWAASAKEEVPCPGLTVTIVRRMENVTDKILKGLSDTVHNGWRDSLIAARILNLEKEYRQITKLDASVKPYFYGNQYWVSLTETFRDIRLVGFPPNSIGNFGGDVENWAWPRHTGDFSMFRIYADSNNKPADYAKNNKAYTPKDFFVINAGGFKEGDFTMVYGFPGTTEEYISSAELKHIFSISDPVRIEARTKKLEIWDKHMNSSRDIFLKYTSKRAGVANGWKKWQGELRGLKLNAVMEKKEAYEKEFQLWAVKDTTLPYADGLLTRINNNSSPMDSIIMLDEYIKETVLGIELIQQSAYLERLLQCFRAGLSKQALQDTLKKTLVGLKPLLKNYDAATDKELFQNLLPLFFKDCAPWIPPYYQKRFAKHEGNFAEWADAVYKKSFMANEDKLTSFTDTAQLADSTFILSDPGWKLFTAINELRKEKVAPRLAAYYKEKYYLDRLYMKSQMAKDKRKTFYPDANLTLRLTYGKIQGMDPEGPEGYSYQTNIDQLMAHENPDVDMFKVPQKLKELYTQKDYGRWAVKGTVPLAFIASTHTTGGNSGSPVLNAKGQLIGTNFDRPWEGTMSDLYYDPNLCRNISLDIRYTLFIVEKFGGAGWLLNEMKIVK